MKIAYFTDTFLPSKNGVVTYVVENAKRLAERGHEVVVFAPKPGFRVKFNFSQFKFKTVLLPSLPAFFFPEERFTLPNLPKLLIDLKKFKCEIIHIQMPFPVGFDGLFASKILKIPLVATFHSFYIDKPFFEDLKLEKLHGLLENPLWNLCTSFHNQADIVICPSKAGQNTLKKYGLNKPSIVISNGLDLRAIKKGQKENISVWQSKFEIAKTDKVAIFSGRLQADKNIETLIRIWRKVVIQIPNAKLMIIGSGPMKERLRFLTKKFKLTRNIIFTGSINRDILIESGLLRVGQLAVSASKIENQSYALLEEMAFGLPIVAFNIRGIPEIVDHENGILIDPDDIESFANKTIELLKDEKEMEELSKGAIKKSERFDLDKNLDQVVRVYSNLIEKKKST